MDGAGSTYKETPEGGRVTVSSACFLVGSGADPIRSNEYVAGPCKHSHVGSKWAEEVKSGYETVKEDVRKEVKHIEEEVKKSWWS